VAIEQRKGGLKVPLFQRKTPEPAPPLVTGKDVLRDALRARNKGPYAIGLLKEELQVSSDVLHAFAGGADNLLDDKLTGLAKFLFGGMVEFDAESGLLRSANREPARSVGVAPPAWSGGSNVAELNGRTPGVIYQAAGYPRPPDAEPAPPSRAPGWA
jgi:hypothetical protein